MLNRRNFVMTAVSFAGGGALAATPSGRETSSGGRYTATTAPDLASRQILARSIGRIDESSTGGMGQEAAIHRNFPQIIEQNFARLDARQMANLVDSLSDAELSDLAQLYVNATTDQGLPSKLLDVMAHRLGEQRLGRISKHFGFASVYAAVTIVAPTKSNRFIDASLTSHESPRSGEMRFGYAGRYAQQSSDEGASAEFASSAALLGAGTQAGGGGAGRFLHMTLYEIYLDFRTAPVGALGRAGSLWETGVVASTPLYRSFLGGVAVGAAVGFLIQNYAPDLWNSIGAGVASAVDLLSNSWLGSTLTIANAQQSSAASFQVPSLQTSEFARMGGDYGVASEWREVAGSGAPCYRDGNCHLTEY
jgi:hypothetical protein